MNKPKILIVEDEFVVANDLKDSLTRMAYEVTGIVSSGERAIEKIDEDKPELILMDIMLRGNMDGIESAEKIRKYFNLPVIFLTAHADQNILERAKRIEPFGYLIKPVENRELKAAIEMALYKIHVENCRRQMEKESLKIRNLESMAVFAGGIAHDYNNLLTAIMGYISLAQMNTDPRSKIYNLLTEAEKASLRARDLTKKFSAFHMSETLVKRTAPVPPLLKNCIKLILNNSNIRCEFDIPENIWLCEIDEIRISEAIQNIVINARDAMPKGGKIRISVQNIFIDSKCRITPYPALKDGKYVKISIKDQGIGIPETHFEKIFEPYFSTKERGAQKGMGFGLAISDSVIRKHNGYIGVESEPGNGTVFHIYLPASERRIPKEEKPKIKSLSYDTGKKHILVMDDEEFIRDVAGQILEYLGYEVEFAEDGFQAIELYKNMMDSDKGFDAVILDLIIPNGMGGKETIKLLKKIDPHVRAIISSGYSSDPAITEFQEYGFCSAVVKPYKIEELSHALHNALK